MLQSVYLFVGARMLFVAAVGAAEASSGSASSFLKLGLPQGRAPVPVPRRSFLARQRPGEKEKRKEETKKEKTAEKTAPLLEERRKSPKTEAEALRGTTSATKTAEKTAPLLEEREALRRGTPSACCGGKESETNASATIEPGSAANRGNAAATTATGPAAGDNATGAGDSGSATASATTGGTPRPRSNGLVLTKQEVKEMLADAAKRLKDWQEDENGANEKTRKHVQLIRAAQGLPKMLQTGTFAEDAVPPFAAPHNHLKFTGVVPSIKDSDNKQLFGGIGMNDGPQGVNYWKPNGNPSIVYQGEGFLGTAWPAASAIGMSWDPEFAYVYAKALAKEFRINRINVLLGPGVQAWRVPKGARNFESIAGEDPVLAATLLPPYKLATNKLGVATTLKHYLLNDWEGNKMNSCSSTPLRALFELHLKNFAAGLAMGGSAVMCSYNWICGHADENGNISKKMCVGSCLNKWSLSWITDLSERFFVVSDWGATGDNYSIVRAEWPDKEPGLVTADGKPLQKALMEFYLRAGLSSEHQGPISGYIQSVPAEVQEKAVRRIVATMEDVEKSGPNLIEEERISNADYEALKHKHRKIGNKLVADSIVMLKNENRALPLLLRPEDGADGVVIRTYGCEDKQLGYTGQGAAPYVKGTGTPSIEEALTETTDEMRKAGFDIEYLGNTLLTAGALGIAPKGDVSDGKREVVLICAYAAYLGSEGGDRANLNLKAPASLAKTTKADDPTFQVVLFVITPGYIYLPKAALVDSADAILLSVFPGQCAGRGLMRVLFNDSPPSAKLSFTIGNYDAGSQYYSPQVWADGELFQPNAKLIDYTKTDGPEGMQTGHRWYQAKKIEPLFPFGYGLTSLADWRKDFKVSIKNHDAQLRRISFCVDFSLPEGAGGKAWAKLNSKAGRGRNVVKASPVVQFFVKKRKPVESPYFELLAFAKLANMKPPQKRCAAVLYTEPPSTFDQKKRKYIPSTEFDLFVSLNGFAEGSGLQKVETVKVEPTVKEYELKDYYNFVRETVKKQITDVKLWPSLTKHMKYLSNGDEVFENWAA